MSHTKNDYPDNLAWCIDCSSDAGTRRYYSPAHVDLMLAERDAHSAALVAALPPPGKLIILADWLDVDDRNHGRPKRDHDVQDDLRAWAYKIIAALAES